MAILVQPIKAEFHLSDSQVGILTGLAFSTSLAIFGFPVARWADRGSRKLVITLSLAFWSLMTAVSGVTRNYVQLLLARIAVGAGESGNMPAAQAMIADLFQPSFRATALGLFSVGSYGGMMLGLTIGAWLEFHFGWRGALVMVSLPGMFIAALFFMTVKEPMRTHDHHPIAVGPEGFWQALKALWKQPVFKQLLLAHTASIMLSYGQTNWMPAFFERSFGTSRMEIGAVLASTRGFSTMIGVVLGGVIADRLARRGMSGPMGFIIWARFLLVFPTVAVYLSPTANMAFTMSAISGFISTLSIAPDLAILLTIVPAHRRATASAVTMLASSFIGMGLGPVLVGALSDGLAPHSGRESLRYALVILSVVTSLWCMVHYMIAARHLKKDTVTGGAAVQAPGASA
jgi:MFS family permease